MIVLLASLIVVCAGATTETNQTLSSQTPVWTTTTSVLTPTTKEIISTATKSPPVVKNKTVIIPNNTSIVCRITSSDAIIDIKKDNKSYSRIEVANNSFKYKNKKTIASGSNTGGVTDVLIQIPVETLDDQGLYVCHVTYPDNTTDIDNSLNLTVFGKPVLTLFPNLISYTLYDCDPLVVNCQASGRPLPSVYWALNIPTIESASSWLNISKFDMIGSVKYTCHANNTLGNSSITIAIQVLDSKPSAPQEFTSDSEETSIILRWKPSEIFTEKSLFSYNLCGIKLNSTITSYNFSQLEPFTKYTFNLTACNDYGCSRTVKHVASTLEQARPSLPTDFKVDYVSATTVIFSFQHGLHRSAQNISYTRVCYTWKEHINCKNATIENDSVIFTDLSPHTNYSFCAATCVDRKHLTCSREVKQSVRTNMSVSSPVDDIEVTNTDDASIGLNVKWCKPKHINADYVYYTVVYQKNGTEKEVAKITNISSHYDGKQNPCLEQFKYSIHLNNLSAQSLYWVRVDTNNIIGPSIGHNKMIWTDEETPSAPKHFTLVKSTDNSLHFKWVAPTLFTVSGYEINYSIIDSTYKELLTYGPNITEATIRSLKEDTTYTVAIRAYVIRKRDGALFMGPELVNLSKTDKRLNIGIVVSIIIVITVIIIIALIVFYFQHQGILFYRKKLFKKDQFQNETRLTIRKTLKNIEVKRISYDPSEFERRVAELHSNSDYLFSEEFTTLGPDQPESTWNDSRTLENQSKNRYQNVFAYDHTRFRLRAIPGIPGSDYINANFIDGYETKKSYIATQAPLEHTFGDFWRMVWESECQVIVMLTNLFENRKKKCDLYWPENRSETYKGFTVTIEKTQTYASYIKRKLTITKVNPEPSSSYVTSDEVRDVWHYHYTEWPDFGVPLESSSLMSFVLRTREHSDQSKPVIVHCSAGVGRTGTFIVVDAQMRRFDHRQDYDVYNYLKKIRLQRNLLVQQEIQYIFIHDLLLDYMYSGITEISISDLEVALNQDYCRKEVNNKLHKEWELLEKVHAPRHRFSAALRPCNRLKNICTTSALPVDATRVHLLKKPFTDGSDYINASYFDSYHRKKTFIVTQTPLVEEKDEFYRMVWENEVKVVVNLLTEEEMRDMCDINFLFGTSCFIKVGSIEKLGIYCIEIIEERKENNYIYRKLSLSDSSGNTSEMRFLHHYHFFSWPERFFPRMAFLFYFINDVMNCHNQFSKSPILIHCKLGIGRSGILLALILFKEQLEDSLKIVDVFNTVKVLRNQRLDMIQSLEQYEFLYKAVVSLKHFISSNGS